MHRLFVTVALCLLLALLAACLVQPVCYKDVDCADGRVCDPRRGRCEAPRPECSDPEDCAAGFRCQGGRCVPDSTGPLVCPEGMVSVDGAYCMDQYEASRPDASADDAGTDTSLAVSRPGVIPWFENPVSQAAVNEFAAACRRAGKHLCTEDEWYAACAGNSGRAYVFGDIFDREVCNCVDTFCDDYCRENAIADCALDADCGYVYGSFHVAPTGSFPDCVDEYGALDINGNVWEVVVSDSDRRGYEIRGGAFNCAGASERLRCTYNAGWSQLYAGFRCCQGPGDGAVR